MPQIRIPCSGAAFRLARDTGDLRADLRAVAGAATALAAGVAGADAGVAAGLAFRADLAALGAGRQLGGRGGGGLAGGAGLGAGPATVMAGRPAGFNRTDTHPGRRGAGASSGTPRGPLTSGRSSTRRFGRSARSTMSSGAEVLFLDTSAYSWMRSGHPGVLDLVAAAEIVILTATVLGELEGCFELGSRQRENRAALAELLSEPFVRVRHVTPATARRYGEVFAHLRRAGTPIPQDSRPPARGGATLLVVPRFIPRGLVLSLNLPPRQERSRIRPFGSRGRR